MTTNTHQETETGTGVALEAWQGGLIGGLLGGLVFGATMSMQMPQVLEQMIPAGMYGLPASGALGWTIHVAHSAVLGVVFAAIADLGGLDDALDDNLKNGVAGLAYGIVLWAVLAVVVMPIWVSGGSFAGVPNVVPESLLGHAVYGVVLGVAYSVLSD